MGRPMKRTFENVKTEIFTGIIEEAINEHSDPRDWLMDMHEERIKEEVASQTTADDLLLALNERPEFLAHGARPERVASRGMIYLTELLEYLIVEDMVEEFYSYYLSSHVGDGDV